ncbi:MAG: type II secretion system F family protein, partial [Aquificaceae bacterium]
MPKYKYKAFDEMGSLVESEVDYPNQDALIMDLQQKGLTPIQVTSLEEEKRSAFNLSFSFGSKV